MGEFAGARLAHSARPRPPRNIFGSLRDATTKQGR